MTKNTTNPGTGPAITLYIGSFYSDPVTVNSVGAVDGGSARSAIYATSNWTIQNNGYLSEQGTDPSIAGIKLSAGGSVTNERIQDYYGKIYGANAGIIIEGGTGNVVNAGLIASGVGAFGVVLYDGGSVTNMATGTISSQYNGVAIIGDSATIENAGTIIGGIGPLDADTSVYLGATTNRLIVDAGAKFVGVAYAKGADSTLELTAKYGAGTISGIGSQYIGFQTVTIDTGASWDVAGTVAGFVGTTIQGFGTKDALDLTDVTFASGDTVSINTVSDVLTVKNGGGSVLGTVQMAGDFTGDFFHLADDGNHGSYVTEDGTPCYCRGTLILTDIDEIAVEDLKIGDRLITGAGAARPIAWIGTSSYSGRFAEGNRDVLPVLIKAGALADNVPRRDLWVSPLHAMYLDGVLIPAVHLVNGTSIVQAESFDTIEYFHLELETHDVIVAEGALSETFIDDDSRGMFHNAADYRRLYPDAVRKPADYYAPIVEDGEVLEAVRARIEARVDTERMGWAA